MSQSFISQWYLVNISVTWQNSTHRNLLLPLNSSTNRLLSQPGELHQPFTIWPLVSHVIFSFGTHKALSSHRTSVNAVVCDGVDDEVWRWFVTWWRHIAVGVFGRAWIRQVDAALFFNGQRLDARVSRWTHAVVNRHTLNTHTGWHSVSSLTAILDQNQQVRWTAMFASRGGWESPQDSQRVYSAALIYVSLIPNQQWVKAEVLEWLGGVTVTASDLRSGGRGFDSRSGRYHCLGQLSLPSLWGR